MSLDRIYTVFEYENDERLRDVNLRELVEFVIFNIFVFLLIFLYSKTCLIETIRILGATK